jgi:hypothetical protein
MRPLRGTAAARPQEQSAGGGKPGRGIRAEHDASGQQRGEDAVVSDATKSAARFVRSRRDGLRELALVSLFVLAYFGIRNVTAGEPATAYANAARIMRFERAAHLAWEVSLQGPVLAHPALVTLANWIYIWGHWPVIIVTAVLLFRYRRRQYLLLRNALFVSGAIGFLFFGLFPVAPPRLANPALVDTVTLHSNAYRALQPPGLTDQFAAFPSLHFGWNLLAGIAVWCAVRSVPLRALCVLGPAAMAAAVVLTANHYVVDLLGGLTVVLVALAVSLAASTPSVHSAANGVLHRLPRGHLFEPDFALRGRAELPLGARRQCGATERQQPEHLSVLMTV